ncbi:ankyrin repeat-containing domain protein [Xylaria acuta]|nr:ankyrin repeat-containing domain protein [Xylaria acuta]
MAAAWLLNSGVEKINGLGRWKRIPLCWTLCKRNASTQKKLDRSLITACDYTLPRTVEFLLRRGANPNAYNRKGVNALHCLAVAQPEPLKVCCEHDIDRNFKCRPWDWESCIGKTIAALVAHGSDIHSPTRKTCTDRRPQACLKPSDCTHRGETAFHLAAMENRLDVLALLVENGADPHAPDGYGHTALYRALEYKQDQVGDFILGISTDKNPIVYEPTRSTALHIACRFGHMQIIGRLLGRGVSPDVVDSQGYTPLHEVLQNVEYTGTGRVTSCESGA